MSTLLHRTTRSLLARLLCLLIVPGSASMCIGSDSIPCASLAESFAQTICDSFDDSTLDEAIWAAMDTRDPSVRLTEIGTRLKLEGVTSRPDAQTGLGTRSSFDASQGFEVVVLLRALDDGGGGLVIELNDASTYFHVTLMCGETRFAVWYCYFGDGAPQGCHESTASPLVLQSTSRGSREARIRYEGETRTIIATVSGRLVGRLSLPVPLGESFLRLFVQSPLEPSELGDGVRYEIEGVTLGWGHS